MTTDQLVAAYLQLRGQMAALTTEYDAAHAKLKEEQDEVAAALLNICNEQNVDSMRTSMGTVSRRVSSRYWTSDWESMYRFIVENDAPFLLERRISNNMMKQFLEDNPDLHPAGLQADRKHVIQVRKATAQQGDTPNE